MARRKTTDSQVPARVLAAALPERHSNDPAMVLGNPLRNLTPATAATLLAGAMRGEWTRAQWLMYYVEQWDADVWTLVERRCAGLRQLDWTIRTDAEADEGGDEALAEAQKQVLHGWYSQIENMREAVEFLALAKFRGYAHLRLPGNVGGENGGEASRRLEPIDQWWWVREGLYGGWYYNPTAALTTWQALGEPIDESQWIVRCEARSLIWLSIMKFLRANWSQKWWDAFCEEASRQGTVIVGPPGMTPEQQTTFETAALSIARSGSGVLANGSDVKRTGAEAASAAATCWEQRLRFLQEQLILAGTGGQLTALAQATGLGGSQGQEQGDVWRSLLRADAGDISEVFQAQADRRLLAAAFPGRPVLAWFELDASEKPSTNEVIDQVLKLSQAGKTVADDQVSERTGYKVEKKAEMPPAAEGTRPPGPPGFQAAADAAEVAGEAGNAAASPQPGAADRGTDGEKRKALQNRASASDTADRMGTEMGVPAEWLAPVAELLADLEAKAADTGISDADLLAFAEAAAAKLPELFSGLDVGALADVMERAMGAAALEGARDGVRRAAEAANASGGKGSSLPLNPTGMAAAAEAPEYRRIAVAPAGRASTPGMKYPPSARPGGI